MRGIQLLLAAARAAPIECATLGAASEQTSPVTSGDNDAGAGADAVAVTMRLHVLGISAAQSAVTVAAELRDGSGARTERAVVGFGARRASHAQSQSPRGGFGSPVNQGLMLVAVIAPHL